MGCVTYADLHYNIVSRLACRRRLHNNLSLGEKVTSRNVVSVCVTGLVLYSSELHKVQHNVDKY